MCMGQESCDGDDDDDDDDIFRTKVRFINCVVCG